MKNLFAILAMLVLAGAANACPSCYGASDGPMIDGMNAGVGSMLIITGCVLSVIAASFISIMRRARRLNAGSLSATTLTEDGKIEWKNF